MREWTRRHLLAFRTASVAIGVGVGLVASEAILRIFDVGPTFNVIYAENFRRHPDPALRYEWVPGSPDGALAISSAGLRDREFEIPKPEGVFRIACLGDSVTAGSTLARWETWPKQLESLLARYGAPALRYEVLNLGVIGYNAPQVAASLRVRGLAFEPDLVIYGYVLNDPLPSHLIAESLDAMEARARDDWLDEASRRVGRLLAHTRLYALLRPPPPGAIPAADVAWQAPLGRAGREGKEVAYLRALHADPEAWSRVAGALEALAATSPAPVLVALFPIRTGRGFDPYPLADLHAQLLAEARSRGLDALDLTPSFARASRSLRRAALFADIVHPDAAGSQVVAVALLRWLSQAGRLPGGDRPFERLLRGDGTEARLGVALAQPEPPS